MQAIILVAGEGARMRPLTYTRPKVMLPLANKPLLEHLLVNLRGAGISEFIFVVGYCQEAVRSYFGGGEAWDVHIDYVVQEAQLGSGHALQVARGLVRESFLLVNGDAIVGQEDIRRIMDKGLLGMSIAEVENTHGLGVVEIEGDRVVRIHEKVADSPTKLANAGVYFLTSDIFDILPRLKESPRGEYEIVDLLQLLIDQGRIVTHETISFWLHLSYPWELLSANELMVGGIESEVLGVVEDGAVCKGPVRIGRGTVVRANSYIVGPVVVGENCEIGPNCYIRPATCIGDNCHVGAAVEIKNSIVMRNSKIPHHNYVGDSVIGEGCNLGSGTKVANLRLDKGNITVNGVDTGRRKLGVIMGDGVQTSINVSINVGCMIGNNTIIGPASVASGEIPPNHRVFKSK